jgi:hypothetical protein
LNKLRHRKVADDAEDEVIRSFEEFQATAGIASEGDCDAEELRKTIQRGIDELPPRCRQIFLLNRRSGLTYQEIAGYLGVSINTVNTQMGRALQSLRNSLSDYIPAFITAGISKLFFLTPTTTLVCPVLFRTDEWIGTEVFLQDDSADEECTHQPEGRGRFFVLTKKSQKNFSFFVTVLPVRCVLAIR